MKPEHQTVDEPEARAESMLADLRRLGLKMTPQRLAIVGLFARDHSHPTAQALFERLRPDFPSMSFATVYNTLDALTRAGLSSTLRLGNAARFDPNTAPHHHTVCDVCGDVRDMPAVDAPIAVAGPDLTVASGFQVRSVEKVFRGTCQPCLSRPTPLKDPAPLKHERGDDA
jgi:Fe2+ or Zn2+ uptake regulation protein